MHFMRVRQFATVELASLYVASLIEFIISSHEHPVLGLATGSTPIPLYERLVNFHRQGQTFDHVTTINLDEYVGLGANHPNSYNYFMHKHLFNHIDINPAQVHIPNGMAPNMDEECRRFDRVIESFPIDVQILGIGRNGHIGFNEPGQLLTAKTHVTPLAPETLNANARFFKSRTKLPTHAITMGIKSILSAKAIILIAFGDEKAEAVYRSLFGPITTEVPATILQTHKNVTYVLDKQAAKYLPSAVSL